MVFLSQVPVVTVYKAEASGMGLKVPIVREIAPESIEVVEDVKYLVETEFGKDSVMVKIAKCESGFRQFEADGRPLKSHLGTDDIGVFQINVVHVEEMKKLGLDRNKTKDNINFARVLYESQGLSPWFPSKTCWSK